MEAAVAKSSTYEVGTQFEKEIRTLLESAGYKCTPNIEIQGQQIDLVFEKISSFDRVERIIVECKFKNKGNVNNQEVFDFIHMYDSIRISQGISIGIIVSSTGFSKSARSAIGVRDDIFLFDRIDLERELVNLKSIYRSYIMNYEQSDISTKYINIPIYDLKNSIESETENCVINLVPK